MNPCPCGYYGDERRTCVCTGPQIHRYRARVSGPLLDRIDIQIALPPVTIRELSLDTDEEPSAAIRARVIAARARQAERFKGSVQANGRMTARMVKKFCEVEGAGRALLERAVERFGLSARAYHRILKLARTIADLDGDGPIGDAHVAEAITIPRSRQEGGHLIPSAFFTPPLLAPRHSPRRTEMYAFVGSSSPPGTRCGVCL
jgi:magnesium chelatase family protein